MKTRRTIKGTSVGGVTEEAYTSSNPPPYPVVANGNYQNMTVGNATNATNATNDGNGNNISDTYATKNGKYENLAAGTIIEKLLTADDDLNNIIATETKSFQVFYASYSSRPANSPISAAFKLEVLYCGDQGIASPFTLQRVTSCYPYGDGSDYRQYTRIFDGSLWTEWKPNNDVVSSYTSSDGLTWYRIYGDGLKECGGTLTTNSNSTPLTVALPVTYIDTKYKILITPKNLNNTASPTTVKIIKDSITVNSFKVVGCFATGSSQGYADIQFDYYCRRH